MEMRLGTSPAVRLTVVLAFVGAAVGVIIYLLTGTPIRVPVLNAPHDYEVIVDLDDADNLVTGGQIRTAGVKVGDVKAIEQRGDQVRVVLSIFQEHAPLHDGVTVRIGARSLVEETYLDLHDGEGQPMPSGAVLPDEAIEHSTQLRDVLVSLDEPTRAAMSELVQSLGAGTDGTSDSLSRILAGLGDLGREGYTAVDAIAAQSDDLRKLAGNTRSLLAALDAGEGEIATMVEHAQQLTAATAGQHDKLAESVQLLPGVVDSAKVAAVKLTELSSSLAPVARNLDTAAPHLAAALKELPETSTDLHGLLPDLSGVLDRAPATLGRIPRFSADMDGLTPQAITTLRDVNPMLEYVRPYGPEVAGWFANFNAISGYTDETGVHYIRLMPFLTDMSLVSPMETGGILSYHNPIPAPGTGTEAGAFQGKYPRIERDPDPREEYEDE